MTTHRIRWGHVLDAARAIVESYDTPVTLRQLYYRLVASQLIPNVATAYKRLSALTAEARRDEVDPFPDLIDRGRSVFEYRTFDAPRDALDYTARIYRRDRTEGQDVSLYLGVEKAGIVNQLDAWFGDLGVPVLALGGYASQSFADDVRYHVERQDRPGVLLYAGDHDPSGWDIPRDFIERTGCFRAVHRVALTPELIDAHDLPENVGKEDDSRAKAFVARFGRLVQVELDALPPDVLRGLFADAIEEYWDTSAFEAVLEREAAEREVLARLTA
jgi:hypothetical protein